jgi:hypothetical protein
VVGPWLVIVGYYECSRDGASQTGVENEIFSFLCNRAILSTSSIRTDEDVSVLSEGAHGDKMYGLLLRWRIK